MLKFVSFSLAVLASAVEAKSGYCRAAALSGGGANGSWEAGVLWGLANYGTASDYEYDVLTGVSAGSINAAAMAGWKKGSEVEMT